MGMCTAMTPITLYFTNKNGDKLVAEQRSVRYRRQSNRKAIRWFSGAACKRSAEKGHYPTITENSEVHSLTRANGICYVDLSFRIFRIMRWIFSNRIAVYFGGVNTLNAANGLDKS